MSPELPHSVVEQIARGKPFVRSGDPATLLAEIAGLRPALARRPRLIALAAAALTVPLPLVAVPVALAMSNLAQPFDFVLMAGPLVLLALLALAVLGTREAHVQPWTLRVVSEVLPRLAWAPGSTVAVHAEMPKGWYQSQTLWTIDGTLASGHGVRLGFHDRSKAQFLKGRREGNRRILTYQVWREADEEVLVRTTPALAGHVAQRGADVLRALGVPPDAMRVRGNEIGWEWRVHRHDEPKAADLVERVRAILSGLGDPAPVVVAPPAVIVPAAYRPPRWSFYAWIVILSLYALALGLAWLGGLAYVLAPRVGPLAALEPIAMSGDALAIASGGVLVSILAALVLAALLFRESRI